MTETNKQENDKSNEIAGDAQGEEWLEELGGKSEDSSLNLAESPGIDDDDLGEIEPGQEIPDWLRADIIAAESDISSEPEIPDEVSMDETVVAASLDDLTDSEVPEWLEEELANDIGDEAKSEDLSWLEDLAAVPDEAIDTENMTVVDEEAQPEEFSSMVSDIPDDPDDAVAWLEELATEQEDSSIALDTEQPDLVEISVDEEIPKVELQVTDVDLPVDEQAALQWLDEIVSVSMATAAANRIAGASSIVIEPETPKSAFSVEEAMEEAEKMMLEDQIVVGSESTDTFDEIEIDDLDEDEQVVVDWLDELAAVEEPAVQEPAAEEPALQEIDTVRLDLSDDIVVSDETETVPEDATDELDWLDVLDEQSPEVDEPVVPIDEEIAAAVVAEESEDLPEPQIEIDEPQIEIDEPQIEIDETDDSEGDGLDASDQDQYEEAHLALESGDFDQAITVYSEILNSGEGLPELIADLETHVEAYESQPAIQRLLGEAYTKNGQLQEALEIYKKALDNI